MRAMGRTKVFRRNATTLGANHGAGFDLVFMDPPYGKGLGARAGVERGRRLAAPGARVSGKKACRNLRPKASP